MKRHNNIIFILLFSAILGGCSDASDKNLSEEVATVQQPILHGNEINMEFASSIVSIYITDYLDYEDQIVCTGTLITSDTILTAAHCVAKLSEQYLLFSEDASDPDCKWQGGNISTGVNDIVNYLKVGFGKTLKSSQRVSKKVEKIIYHSGYSTLAESEKCTENNYEGYNVTRNDIAILKLESAFDTQMIEPMPILPPWLGINEDQINDGLNVYIMGYGYDEFGERNALNEIKLSVEKYCNQEDGKSLCPYGKTVHVKGCHPNSLLCSQYGKLDYYEDRLALPAGSFLYLQANGGPCQGDSGGPAFVNIKDKYYLAGITSYGDNACSAYGISTAVQDFYDWIVSNVPEIKDQHIEICGNGLDDDNNGKIDGDDPYCVGKSYCGDGILDGNEECEGDQFVNDNTDCVNWSDAFESGKVSCEDNCMVDLSQCVKRKTPVTCGDNKLDDEESCDGNVFADPYTHEILESNLCSDFSGYFNEGTLKCHENCTYDTSECAYRENDEPRCGDDIIQKGELCDGQKFLGGLTHQCTDWDNRYVEGAVQCTRCKPDFSLCIKEDICGDNKLSDAELCDGNLFYDDETDCGDWVSSMASGTVKCNANCSLDTSTCVIKSEIENLCGNGKLEADSSYREECDGELFKNGTKCSDWDSRFHEGTVSCNANCTVNLETCLLASNARYLDEAARSVMYLLNSNEKPTQKAPEKESDTVVIQVGGNLSENLPGLNETPDKPSTDPDDPNTPDDPENPNDPETPQNPENSEDKSSCSSVSRHAAHFPMSIAILLSILLATLGFGRRKTHDE